MLQKNIKISVQFNGNLLDFLSKSMKNGIINIELNENSSVKDVIESKGVPHTEVFYILVDGKAVDFSYNVSNGDVIEVYPLEAPKEVILSQKPCALLFPEPKFILDVHLGTLARKLRLFGFDTLYKNEMDDPEIADIASSEKRIVLTRDLGLLMRSKVEFGYWLRSQDTNEQLMEVFKQYQLKAEIAPFSLCISCNGKIELVDKEEVKEQLEPDTYAYYHEFYKCTACDKLYWKGSHYDKLMEVVESI